MYIIFLSTYIYSLQSHCIVTLCVKFLKIQLKASGDVVVQTSDIVDWKT